MTSHEYDVTTGAEAFTFDSVMFACTTEEEALAWCMRNGLLASAAAYPKCGDAMRRTGMR